MVTSIQIHEDTKVFLTNLKDRKETYDDLIKKLVLFYESKKKVDDMILEDAYKYIAENQTQEDIDFVESDLEDWPEW